MKFKKGDRIVGLTSCSDEIEIYGFIADISYIVKYIDHAGISRKENWSIDIVDKYYKIVTKNNHPHTELFI